MPVCIIMARMLADLLEVLKKNVLISTFKFCVFKYFICQTFCKPGNNTMLTRSGERKCCSFFIFLKKI